MSFFIKNSKILKSKTFHTTGIGEYFISTPEVVKSKSNLKFYFEMNEEYPNYGFCVNLLKKKVQ